VKARGEWGADMQMKVLTLIARGNLLVKTWGRKGKSRNGESGGRGRGLIRKDLGEEGGTPNVINGEVFRERTGRKQISPRGEEKNGRNGGRLNERVVSGQRKEGLLGSGAEKGKRTSVPRG